MDISLLIKPSSEQEMEHSNGLSNGYARNEGRLIADLCIGLNRLKYTTYIKLPTDFQELLNGNFGDMCSFLYALHPVNICT